MLKSLGEISVEFLMWVPGALAQGETNEIPGQVYVLLLVVVLLAVFMIRRYKGRKTKTVEAAAQYREGPRAGDENSPSVYGQDARPELEKLSADLHEFSREMEARMDTKIAYLRGVLDEATQVASRLEGLIERAVDREGAVEPAASSTAPERREALVRSEPLVQTAGLESIEDAVESEELAQLTAAEPPTGDGAPEPDQEPVGGAVDITVGPKATINHRVIQLHRDGREPGEIAMELDLPRGEVELMINLAESAQN